VLKRHSTEIRRYKTFQDLFAAIEAALKPVHGIGELAIYDIALRIGARCEIEPENVYLHRGTREGAGALGFDKRLRYIEPDTLPREFRRLKPYEIEDALCRYKSASALARIGRQRARIASE
jgi:hypothetical protein